MIAEELKILHEAHQASVKAGTPFNWSRYLSILIAALQEWLAARGTPVEMPEAVKHSSSHMLTTDQEDQQMIDFLHRCAATVVTTTSENLLLKPSVGTPTIHAPAPAVKETAFAPDLAKTAEEKAFEEELAREEAKKE